MSNISLSIKDSKDVSTNPASYYSYRLNNQWFEHIWLLDFAPLQVKLLEFAALGLSTAEHTVFALGS